MTPTDRDGQMRPSEAKITREEIRQMFGDTLPMEAVALIWDSPGDMTIGQVRAKLRELAAARKERLSQAAPDLYDAIRNSDNAHWTPAMRAAMAKAEGR